MTDLTLIQRTTGTISKNDFIVCRKNAKPQRGGGEGERNRRPTPPDAALPNRQTKKIRKKKKKEKRGEGKGERKSL